MAHPSGFVEEHLKLEFVVPSYFELHMPCCPIPSVVLVGSSLTQHAFMLVALRPCLHTCVPSVRFVSTSGAVSDAALSSQYSLPASGGGWELERPHRM